MSNTLTPWRQIRTKWKNNRRRHRELDGGTKSRAVWQIVFMLTWQCTHVWWSHYKLCNGGKNVMITLRGEKDINRCLALIFLIYSNFPTGQGWKGRGHCNRGSGEDRREAERAGGSDRGQCNESDSEREMEDRKEKRWREGHVGGFMDRDNFIIQTADSAWTRHKQESQR